MSKLTEEDIVEIIELYTGEIPSTHKLATKFKVGHKKISAVLKDNDIPINKRGGQVVSGNASEVEKSNVVRYESKDENKKLIAVCKATGIEFDDANNLSGCLTRYIIELYGDIPIPANTYQRKKYEQEFGKKWFEEYFDVKIIDKPKARVCGMCDWETEDIENKTGCFEVHLSSVHDTPLEEYLSKFPDDIKYHVVHKNRLDRLEVLKDEKNVVVCRLCDEKMKVITNTHLMNKHSITPHEYKLKFPNDKLLSDTCYNVFSENYKNANITMKPTWTSKAETDILNFLVGLGVNVDKSRNRGLLSGSELDLVLPDYNLAIEYNGLYWHTESKGKHSTYHINKTKKCNEIDYSLIHIFEDEWENKKELIQYKLKHILNLSGGIKIGARKCIIREITNKEKNQFLNTYHIQGTDKSNIIIGAFFGELLVGVMTFNRGRNMTRDNTSTYELSRFATSYDYIISGLSSKMLKYFINHYEPTKIISFADRRWTLDAKNNMYTKLGFELTNIGKPSYFYYNSKVNKLKRFHKFGFGKSSLRKKYPYLDFSKTEKVLTTELGYDRIWDCGLFKYELEIG